MSNLKNQPFKNSSLVGSSVKSNLHYLQPSANATYSLSTERVVSVSDQIKAVVKREFQKLKQQ